jgi:hypothetical protein
MGRGGAAGKELGKLSRASRFLLSLEMKKHDAQTQRVSLQADGWKMWPGLESRKNVASARLAIWRILPVGSRQ